MKVVHGIHHITAIAGQPQENADFYAGILGMRLVKRSINQDDPSKFTRSWFAWANTLFGEFVLKVLNEHPQVLQRAAS